MSVFKEIGYFEELFIDFAWYWNTQKLGYHVMINNSVLLHHQTSGHLTTIFGMGIDKASGLTMFIVM